MKTAHFVCDEVAHEVVDNTSDDYIDFGIAFETLLGKLKQNPNETLVLICTYQAISDGYDPNGYVQQLLNYFDELVANNTVEMPFIHHSCLRLTNFSLGSSQTIRIRGT